MMRIALHGHHGNTENYLELIGNFPQFVVAGIFRGENNIDLPGPMVEQPAPPIISEDDLIFNSDVILFLDFIKSDFPLLKKAMKASRHVFINPVQVIQSDMLAEIQKLGEEAGIMYYITHKSLDPELRLYLENSYENLEFIDIYRYVPSANASKESSIRKIISRELLFLFSVNNCHELKKYKLKTVPYCSATPFIVNLRFDFSNSSTANLTINFFTQNNARFAELFYSNNLLRINSREDEVEFIEPESQNYIVKRKKYSLKAEGDPANEISSFLNHISEKKLHTDYNISGLFAHKIIWEVVNQISTVNTNSV